MGLFSAAITGKKQIRPEGTNAPETQMRVNILIISATYPYDGFPFTGIFNERCVIALKGLCDKLAVLAPRPYVPKILATKDRWKIYSGIKVYEERNGVPVYRPPMYQLPKIRSGFWCDYGAYFSCRHSAQQIHKEQKFDAILSFNLLGAGGLAWRIGRELGIPSFGWATGNDVRVNARSSDGKVVVRALRRLDLVFYQSRELRDCASRLVGHPLAENHVVLSRGIPIPPPLDKEALRKRMRKIWGIPEGDIVAISVGRIIEEKGIPELLDAMTFVLSREKRITFILIGSFPEFDDTERIRATIGRNPILKDKILILPACHPDEIWENLCGGDIFLFASRREGMPNSLLEAMSIGLPAVAFAIPPVDELDSGTGSLLKVPPFRADLFGTAVLDLAASSEMRNQLGDKAKKVIQANYSVGKNMSVALERISRVIRQKPR